jgi:hypothetical protein
MFGLSVSPMVLIFVLTAVAGYYAVLVFDDPEGANRTLATIASGGTESQSTPAEVPVVSAIQDEAAARSAPPEKISGEATVAEDGSLEILGTKIHLNGLVLPAKPGEGIKALRDYAKADDIYCSLLSGEISDVRAGSCWTLSGGHPIDIVAELIMAGSARECVKESNGRYFAFEQMSARDIVIPPACSDGGDETLVSSSSPHD